MPGKLFATFESTIEPNEHPDLQGAGRPTSNEWHAPFTNGDVEVIGAFPADIDGVYFRTVPTNPNAY